EGDVVAAGQTLAVLASPDLARQIASVEEELRSVARRAANHQFILMVLDDEVPASQAAANTLEYAATTLSVLDAQQQIDRDVLARLETNVARQRMILGTLEVRRAEKLDQLADVESLFERGLNTRAAVDAAKESLGDTLDEINSLDLSISAGLREIAVLTAKLRQDRLALRERNVEALFGIEQERTLLEAESRALEARRAALTILAPEDGTIHSVGFPNDGEIIDKGEALFELLPSGEALVAVLRLPTREIGHVAEGMEVSLRLETFDARTTPALDGRIASISPNRVFDRDLGEDYFRATVEVMPDAALGDTLRAGMAVTAEIVTDERSMMSYILKPIERSVSLAFNER
ncbi:MAG: HlyD family efflux transporter periplasmic adaptor subunit, partial [Planctomycetota bacterium]